jgi:hypothetical protein
MTGKRISARLSAFSERENGLLSGDLLGWGVLLLAISQIQGVWGLSGSHS